MIQSTFKCGYYDKSQYSNKSLTSTKLHSEEKKYYSVITISLVCIGIVSILASYLMPTVPL